MQSCTRFTPKEKADAHEGAKELVQSIQQMEETGMICRHDGTRAPRQATSTSSADAPEAKPPIAASFIVDLENNDDEDLSSIPPGDMLDDVVQRYKEAHNIDEDMEESGTQTGSQRQPLETTRAEEVAAQEAEDEETVFHVLGQKGPLTDDVFFKRI